MIATVTGSDPLMSHGLVRLRVALDPVIATPGVQVVEFTVSETDQSDGDEGRAVPLGKSRVIVPAVGVMEP
jgi:hypothetical protein